MATTAAAGDGPVVAVGRGKKNRIQVSTNKKPLFFYVNLAKRYMQQHNEIELSALGMAIGTVVTVVEILKNNGLATAKKIQTSTVGTKDEAKGRLVRKAKIEILLGKTDNFNDIVSADKAVQEKAENGTKNYSKDINSAGKVSHGAAGNEKTDNSNGIVSADQAVQEKTENGTKNYSKDINSAGKVSHGAAGNEKTDNSNGIVSADKAVQEKTENGTKNYSKDINSAGKVSHGAAGNEKTDNSNGIVFADKVAQDAAEDGTKDDYNGIVSADQAALEAPEDEKKK